MRNETTAVFWIVAALFGASCGKKEEPQLAAEPLVEAEGGLDIQMAPPPRASVSPVSDVPDWSSLDRFQKTISRADFETAYRTVYHDGRLPTSTLKWDDSGLRIETAAGSGDFTTIEFAEPGQERPAPRFWRAASELPSTNGGSPLAGLKIAIDPGHIGGVWARMEERWLSAPGYPPVMEGELTLKTALKLADRLRAQGAQVTLIREKTEPVTPLRPRNFYEVARWSLAGQGVANPVESYAGLSGAAKLQSVEWVAERFFYRASEIRARAVLVNEKIQPDLVLCLHFDAAAWGNATSPIFTDDNHFHVLVNGCYSSGELAMDDVRHSMLTRLLEKTEREEIAVSSAVATAFAKRSGLPPRVYQGAAARKVNQNPYVWARNLLANREYLAPVVYMEPYVMNHELVVKRISAGDYEGVKEVAGAPRISIFEEYVQGMMEGLVNYYGTRRAR